MKEQAKHIDAFYYFFNLTEKGYTLTESVKITAEHMGITDRTVWNWYNRFDWEYKSQEKRKKIADEMEEISNKSLAENRLNYLKILHKVLDNFIQDDFPVSISNIRDLETIIKSCLVLQDHPSDYIKTSNTNVDVNAESLFDENLMASIMEEEDNNKTKEN